MPARRSRRYYLWAPLAVGAAAVAVLLLAGPPAPQAQAAAAADAARPSPGSRPPTSSSSPSTCRRPPKPQPADKLRVELIGPDGKVLDSGEQQAQPGDAPTTHRFELLSPKTPAEKVTLRCTFGKEKMETPLDKVLLVKAHETALSGGQEFFAGAPPPSAAKSTASSPSPKPCRCAALRRRPAHRQGRQGDFSLRGQDRPRRRRRGPLRYAQSARRHRTRCRSSRNPTSARRSWSAT